MKPIVSVQKLSKSFSSGDQTVLALKSVNLEIKKGEVFGLLGPNGAGKTTLIAILCGFLIPDEGSARIFGMDCTRESEKIQKRMNLVSGFSGIPEFITAEEILYIYCMLYNLDNIDARVKKALEITKLEKSKKRIADDFSSGLRRRLFISRALLNEPELLLLDEPTVGLDVDSAYNMRKLIKKMKREGRAILLTTHNMKEAEELCDRVALIKEGRIIACGTFSELRRKFFPLKVLEITCNQTDKVEKLISDRKSVVKTKKSKNKIKIYLNDKADLGKILKLITGAEINIKKINTIEPELEDVYTKLIMSDNNEGLFLTHQSSFI